MKFTLNALHINDKNIILNDIFIEIEHFTFFCTCPPNEMLRNHWFLFCSVLLFLICKVYVLVYIQLAINECSPFPTFNTNHFDVLTVKQQQQQQQFTYRALQTLRQPTLKKRTLKKPQKTSMAASYLEYYQQYVSFSLFSACQLSLKKVRMIFFVRSF